MSESESHGQVVRGCIVGTDYLSEIVTHSGVISEIRRVPGETSSSDCWISPGFIDIQVNGWRGKNFNRESVMPEDVLEVVRMLWEYGVTTFLPTVTTESRESLSKSMAALRQAAEESAEVDHACPLIHLEGPYISPQDGPRGAHTLEHVRPPTIEEFGFLQECAGGRIGLVTLAPEQEGAIPFMEELAGKGIVMAIGHSDASPEDIAAAVNAGAKLSTHLGNGSHAKIDRHRNYMWEQLARDELSASLITDGHHLPPAVVKCMVRCKGVERSLLITDAVGLAGLPAGLYSDWDKPVEVTQDGAARLHGTPYLAGAIEPLTRNVQRAVQFAGISLADAINMVTINHARLMGMADRIGSVEVGKDADLVLFDWDNEKYELTVTQTMSQGQWVFPNGDSQ